MSLFWCFSAWLKEDGFHSEKAKHSYKACAVAMMDAEGRISDEFFFRNSNEGIGNLISRLSMDDMIVM
jgi:hypothetical protein